jgi:SAM-dependent methyltransferase
MTKRPVSPAWFDQLEMTKDYRNDFKWLVQLSRTVESIVNFGCWSAEPFGLLWTLDATSVTVVEKEEQHLVRPKEILENLQKSNPDCLEGRSVKIHPPADMITTNLAIGHFDLAYCERVLTNMETDLEVQAAVNKMAQVVKPRGWVIAVESLPDEQRNPRPRENIALLFIKAGLVEERLDGAPEDAYCYRKPLTETG